MADEKDAEKLYERLDPREWYRIDCCLKYSPHSRTEILEAIDAGLLDAKQNFWGLFIHREKWTKNMVKTCCDNEQCAKIADGVTVTITNKCGIHHRPTALIATLMLNHPSVELYLCYQGRFYNLERHDLVLFLPSLRIGVGSNLTFKAKSLYRNEPRVVLKKLEQLVLNGFYVDKDISVKKVLENLS